MHLSVYFQNLIVAWLRGANFPAAVTSLKIGLSSANPLADGSGLVEPTDAGYARQTLILKAPTEAFGIFSASSQMKVTFGPAATTPWTALRYIAIFDQNSNLLMFGELNTPRTVPVGDSIALEAGDVQLRLEGAFGKFAALGIFNWMRGIAMPAAPAELKLALSTTDPKSDGSGMTELSTGDGYERQVILFSNPIYVIDKGTTIELDSIVMFGPASVNHWTGISHGAIMSGADVLMYGAFAAQRTVVVGDSLPLATSSIQFLIR